VGTAGLVLFVIIVGVRARWLKAGGLLF